MTLNEAKLFEMLGRATAEAQLLREALAQSRAREAELEAQAGGETPEGQARH